MAPPSFTMGLVNCPHCKESGAYTGLLWVHCQNTECKYFDALYTEKVKREERDRDYDYGYGIQDAVSKLILLRGEVVD